MACEITAQRASEFGIPSQGPDESDGAFRERVAAQLRAMGKMIEAHEAQANALYDDPNGFAELGILGAVAQQMAGRGFGATTWADQVGDDIAAGVTIRSPKDNGAGLLALLILLNK